MSCNAWNHPPGCTCDFRGGWRGVYGGGDDHPPGYWQRSDSYTDPNARCPKCGASVFFYKSPMGGRVFFDELGPPWPKHPCTDNGAAARGRNSGPRPRSLRPATARADRWLPLFCARVERSVSYPTAVTVLMLDLRVKGSKRYYGLVDRGQIDHRTPFLWKQRDDGSIEVSTLDAWGRVQSEVRFVAYKNPELLPEPYRSKLATATSSDLAQRRVALTPSRAILPAASPPSAHRTRGVPTAPTVQITVKNSNTPRPAEKIQKVMKKPERPHGQPDQRARTQVCTGSISDDDMQKLVEFLSRVSKDSGASQ